MVQEEMRGMKPVLDPQWRGGREAAHPKDNPVQPGTLEDIGQA